MRITIKNKYNTILDEYGEENLDDIDSLNYQEHIYYFSSCHLDINKSIQNKKHYFICE